MFLDSMFEKVKVVHVRIVHADVQGKWIIGIHLLSSYLKY